LKVSVLYFAQARERAGCGQEWIELAAGADLEAARAAIRAAHPNMDPLWPHLAVAIDGVLAPAHATLRDGAEIALLPPVSGG